MLELDSISAGYGKAQVLRDFSLSIRAGEIVCLLGRNGAGKTTCMKAIMGLLPLMSGRVLLDGQEVSALPAHHVPRAGIGYIPQGRRLFAGLSVAQNLEIGLRARGSGHDTLEEVLELFPILEEKAHQPAGSLSGGQQQMVAIGRAMMSRPRLLMLDEPSLGLAPLVVKQMFETIQQINSLGTTVLLAEQNAFAALKIATHAYVMENGQLVMDGDRETMLGNEEVRKAYIGS